MKDNLIKKALTISKAIQSEVNQVWLPPADGLSSHQELVLAKSIVKGTRVYIEKVVNQINSTYENGCYDGCAVLVRRLIETLIIEVFEHYTIDNKIKTSSGDFLYLKDLINCTLNEGSWNLGRNTRQALPKLKNIGDLSAHSRRYTAHRDDIDKILSDLRIVVQELVYLADIKR